MPSERSVSPRDTVRPPAVTGRSLSARWVKWSKGLYGRGGGEEGRAEATRVAWSRRCCNPRADVGCKLSSPALCGQNLGRLPSLPETFVTNGRPGGAAGLDCTGVWGEEGSLSRHAADSSNIRTHILCGAWHVAQGHLVCGTVAIQLFFVGGRVSNRSVVNREIGSVAEQTGEPSKAAGTSATHEMRNRLVTAINRCRSRV